ncbi:PAP2 superfamily-domain-containing protein [Aspergillus insuetus]
MADDARAARRFTLLAGEGHRTSKRVILSYIFDWICIILFAGAGAILYSIKGSEHVFSLDDPLISYPLRSDTVSVITVGITCCAVPAIIIAAFSLLPFPQLSLPWPLRLWTLHAALLGLALSLAGAFFTTSALKGIVGKPRPDLLARCAPDLSKITQQTISGLGLHRSTAPVLVSAAICTNPDPKVIRDGFAAFPSGHCTFAWAGLLYFSLWLAAKFGLFFRGAGTGAGAGAPPLYLLVLAATPVGGALYISASRYMDYMHAGWDILGGSMVGITFSVLGFFCGLESSMQTQSGFGGEEYVDIELGAVARQGQKQGHGTGMSGGSGGGGSSSGRTLQVQNM